MKPFGIATKHLPKQAGVAEIKWTEGGLPRREGTQIALPLTETCEFRPLKNDRQFIYYTPRRQYQEAQCWFGGTDEAPFLVELAKPAETAKLLVAEKGEAAFYQYLKPSDAKFVEQLFGQEAKRQGDIFAVAVPWSWEELQGFAMLLGAAVRGSKPKDGQVRVFETRHVLQGQCLETVTPQVTSYNERIGERRMVFGSGILEAPDHAPRILEGVHALFQVEVLARPREAD